MLLRSIVVLCLLQCVSCVDEPAENGSAGTATEIPGKVSPESRSPGAENTPRNIVVRPSDTPLITISLTERRSAWIEYQGPGSASYNTNFTHFKVKLSGVGSGPVDISGDIIITPVEHAVALSIDTGSPVAVKVSGLTNPVPSKFAYVDGALDIPAGSHKVTITGQFAGLPPIADLPADDSKALASRASYVGRWARKFFGNTHN